VGKAEVDCNFGTGSIQVGRTTVPLWRCTRPHIGLGQAQELTLFQVSSVPGTGANSLVSYDVTPTSGSSGGMQLSVTGHALLHVRRLSIHRYEHQHGGVGHDWHWSHSHFWRSNDHRSRSRDYGGRSGSSWRFSDGHSEGDRKSGLLQHRSHFEADGFWFQGIQCGPRFSDDGSRCFGTGYRLNFVNFPLASRARSRGFPAHQRRRAMLIWRRVSAV
jgi:hypothetical protein